MPGLRNRSTWAPLLLKGSCIKSCANGCSLGITSHLTYANTDSEPVEGVFVYPLGEKEVVVGFEAVIAGRVVSVQIQSRGKMEDCCLDCCGNSSLDMQCTNSKDWGCCGSSNLDMQCTNGHLILDEDLERTTFIVGTGVIGPMEVVTIIITTTLELPTLENGAIRLVYPSVLTPIVRGRMVSNKSESGVRWDEQSPTSCFGGTSGKQERLMGPPQYCAHGVFTSPAVTHMPYELSFQLLVRGACLLAGLESPTHALRADADPSAQCATATYITLAEDHRYDRHLEIILHLSEPHSPLIILERGRLTFQEYEQHISARRDYIRCAKKESDSEKKLEFVRKRFHKDILCNPVLMLNFCPDLLSDPVELHRATREVIFLIDRSGSMSGGNIDKIKEAMVVALKSLPPGTLLNLVGFGSSTKTLFTSSKLCTDETLVLAYEYAQKMRADMGGTNLLGALSWVYQQPVQRSSPRQVFIITDGTVSNVGKVLELVRRNACSGRCFGVGLGPLACRRLLQGVAKITGGITEFLSEDERLQPKLVKSLKKAFEPVLTDVRIDWYVPDNLEALLSPNEIPPLYPGNCLIGYCTIYDVSAFKSKKNEAKSRVYKGLSRGSMGSVFGHSQDELCVPFAADLLEPLLAPLEQDDVEEAVREISREISSEFSCARPTDASPGSGGEAEPSSDVRRRIQRDSYVQEQYVLTRCSLSSERGLTQGSSGSECPQPALLDTVSLPQGLERMAPPEQRRLSRWESPWQHAQSSESAETVSFAESGKAGRLLSVEESRRRQKALARSAMASRSFSSPQGELDMHRLRRALEKVSFDQAVGGRLDESDGEAQPTPRAALSRRSLTDSSGLLFPASPLDWDSFTDPEYLFSAAPPEEPHSIPGLCRSVIHGVLSGKPVSWEVTVDLSPLWLPEGPAPGPDGWEEIVHHLTARSVIRDFENMAEKESDIEHGPAKRYRIKAIQTSKGCNTICMYTAFAAVDGNTKEGLTGSVEVRNTGVRFGARRSSHSGSRRQRAYSTGLGRRPSSRDSEEFEDTFASTDREDTPASPCSLTSWDSSTGGSWCPVSPSATSVRSQRSMESRSVETFFGSRFSLGKLRGPSSSGKQAPLKPYCLSAEAEKPSDCETADYMQLVRLQLASGAFLLTELYSECLQIPLERLKRASPYTSHRSSLSPPFHCGSPHSPAPSPAPAKPPSACNQDAKHRAPWPRPSQQDPTPPPCEAPSSEETSPEPGGGPGQADSGRGSETDACEGSPMEPPEPAGERLALRDLEGSTWATAVALAWLEHRCAGFFVEWELVAAKADFWLRGQTLPEGVDLAGLKGAARQLFLLLRHWDENIKLNMLCYNPNNM
ncbi:von Willebrand factor A domain-containing protein 5B1 isoform X5 [Anguilla rostrata]|uniref:von Willebrand factor A domain-containing protein 5B1 isoform X5 n=1 Tax=Anguilla rostrata TaxID=7938 RepID=UPI0030CED7F0